MESTEEPKAAEPFVTREYKGFYVLKMSEVEDFPTFRCRESDIWVCSVPRSGTTLTQQITYLIMTLDFEKARTVQLDDRFPLADCLQPSFPYFRGLKYLDGLPETDPRFIKCHLPYCLLPDQLQAGKGKIIYITRNPKASVVSLYKVLSYMAMPPTPTLREYAEDFIEGKTVYGAPWDKHFKSYWDHRNDENVLFIQFEQLVKDRRGMIEKIAAFLGKDLSKENVDRIFEETSLENMKSNDAVNFMYFEEKFQHESSHGSYINTGDNFRWRQELPEDLIQGMNQLIEKATKGTDITFE